MQDVVVATHSKRLPIGSCQCRSSRTSGARLSASGQSRARQMCRVERPPTPRRAAPRRPKHQYPSFKLFRRLCAILDTCCQSLSVRWADRSAQKPEYHSEILDQLPAAYIKHTRVLPTLIYTTHKTCNCSSNIFLFLAGVI